MRHLIAYKLAGDAEHLIDRRQAGAALGHAVVGHRGHALVARDLLKVDRVGLGPDRRAQRGRHLDHFKHATASAKAGEAAPLAALGMVNGISGLEAERGVALVAARDRPR